MAKKSNKKQVQNQQRKAVIISLMVVIVVGVVSILLLRPNEDQKPQPTAYPPARNNTEITEAYYLDAEVNPVMYPDINLGTFDGVENNVAIFSNGYRAEKGQAVLISGFVYGYITEWFNPPDGGSGIVIRWINPSIQVGE